MRLLFVLSFVTLSGCAGIPEAYLIGHALDGAITWSPVVNANGGNLKALATTGEGVTLKSGAAAP